jgi:hypothetical protein
VGFFEDDDGFCGLVRKQHVDHYMMYAVLLEVLKYFFNVSKSCCVRLVISYDVWLSLSPKVLVVGLHACS